MYNTDGSHIQLQPTFSNSPIIRSMKPNPRADDMTLTGAGADFCGFLPGLKHFKGVQIKEAHRPVRC